MGSFDRYTNYRSDAGVSSVVFGADKTLLEVELNEMQEISKNNMRDFFKSVIGDGITDISALTYSDGNIRIASGCGIAIDGILVNCSGLSIAASSGTVYLQVWEDTESFSAILHKEGNQQDSATVSNWFKDDRSSAETTMRKVVKYQLATSADVSKHNLAIASISGGVMTKLVHEINLSNLTADMADVKGYIGMTDPDIYGVEVDWKNNKFTRLSSAIGKNGGSDFDSITPWNRRRCNVTDVGEVVAYYGDDGYTETGRLTQAITIGEKIWQVGTYVQVMVEQNMFFYRMVPISLEPANDGYGWKVRKARYYISATPKAGFKLFPAFRRNSKIVTKIYDSAFEGCIFDASANSYITNDSVTVDYSADKLSSIAKAKPASGITNNFTRANGRKLGNNRGTGWAQCDFLIDTMTQWLFLVEYASMDAQTKIGKGVCDFTDDGSTNMSLTTGETSILGNESGTGRGTNGKMSVSYRGKENPFGNIWKWSDGLNYNGTTKHAYWADHGFADDTANDPYHDCGFALAGTNGYVSAFGWSEDCDFAFLPTETAGDSSKPVGDYHWQNTGWRVALLGGGWNDGLDCGLCYWYLDGAASDRGRNVGGRLVYIPTAA